MIMIQTLDFQVWNRSWYSCVRCGIFQSFRDINDLIEEMLETEGRYASVEAELKEMHDRYSQLSLKFAEVEGDRQS
ncbi:hypothetical protein Bca4012_055123 [Brassica carinata]